MLVPYKPNLFRIPFPLELYYERVPTKIPQEIIIGDDAETGEKIYIKEEDLNSHIYALGATGSGKTYGLYSFYANLIALGRRCIIIDPLGALYDLFYERWVPYLIQRYGDSEWFQKEFLQKMLFFDLSDKNHPHRSNILQGIGDEDIDDTISRLLKFANVAFASSEGGDDAMSIQYLRRLGITNIIPIFVASKTSFSQVQNFIMNKEFRTTICNQAEQKSNLPQVHKAIKYWTYLEENLKGSSFVEKTFSLLTAFNQLYESPVVKNLLLTEESNVDWQDIFDTKSLFIKFPVDDISAENILVTYIYNNLFHLIKKRDLQKNNDIVYIAADEAASAPIFNKALSKIVCISRNKKVFFCFAHQARQQLISEERMRIAETIEAQCGITMYFRVNWEDSMKIAQEHLVPNDQDLRYIEQTPTFTQSISSAFSQSLSKASSWAKSLVFGKTFNETFSQHTAENESCSNTISVAKMVNQQFSRAEGKTETFIISEGQNFGITLSNGINEGRVLSEGFQYTQTNGIGVAEVETKSGTVTISSSQSRGSSSSSGQSTTNSSNSGESRTTPVMSMEAHGQTYTSQSTGSSIANAMSNMESTTNSISEGRSESEGESFSQNRSKSFSNALGASKNLGNSIAVIKSHAENFARSISEGKSFGNSINITRGFSHGDSISKAKGKTTGKSSGKTMGKSHGESMSEGDTTGKSITQQESISKTVGESVSISVKKVFFSLQESLEKLARKIRDLPVQHALVSIKKQKRHFVKMANCPNLPYKKSIVNQLKEFHERLATDKDATFAGEHKKNSKKSNFTEVYSSFDFEHFLPEPDFD